MILSVSTFAAPVLTYAGENPVSETERGDDAIIESVEEEGKDSDEDKNDMPTEEDVESDDDEEDLPDTDDGVPKTEEEGGEKETDDEAGLPGIDDAGSDTDESPNFTVKEITSIIKYDENRTDQNVPSIRILDKNGVELGRKHFTIEYLNRNIPGKAKVVVTGTGDYHGTIEMPYALAYDIKDETEVVSVGEVEFSYEPQAPEIVIQHEGETLEKDVDYIITTSNTGISDYASATVKGIGKFTGKKNITYSIVPARENIVANNVTIKYSDLVAADYKVQLDVRTNAGHPKLSFDNKCFHADGQAVLGITSSGLVTVPKGFIGTEKIKITAKTYGYEQDEKTISLKIVFDKFPYTASGKTYKSANKITNVALKNINAHKKSFRINMKVKTSMTTSDYLSYLRNFFYHKQIKSCPYVMTNLVKNCQIKYDAVLKRGGYIYATVYYKPTYEISKAKQAKLTTTLKAKIKSIGADRGSTKSRITKIYKWVTKKVKYAYDADGTASSSYQSAYLAYYKKKAVCGGFASLMVAMCNLAGIDAIRAISIPVGSHKITHAFVLVKCGGKWYCCDPTWDAGEAQSGWDNFMKPYNKDWRRVYYIGSGWTEESYHKISDEWLKYNTRITLAKK